MDSRSDSVVSETEEERQTSRRRGRAAGDVKADLKAGRFFVMGDWECPFAAKKSERAICVIQKVVMRNKVLERMIQEKNVQLGLSKSQVQREMSSEMIQVG